LIFLLVNILIPLQYKENRIINAVSVLVVITLTANKSGKGFPQTSKASRMLLGVASWLAARNFNGGEEGAG